MHNLEFGDVVLLNNRQPLVGRVINIIPTSRTYDETTNQTYAARDAEFGLTPCIRVRVQWFSSHKPFVTMIRTDRLINISAEVRSNA